jgi:hypothetical protein
MGLRLESIRSDGIEADALLRGQKNMTNDDMCKNYSWVYGASLKFTTCSQGDEYVKLDFSDAGKAKATDSNEGNTDEAFYQFAKRAYTDLNVVMVLFPLFLFNFLEHFTLMFFGVTLVPNEKVDKVRFEANSKLWVKVANAYVECIKHLRAQLGEKHVELSIMCYQLRREITARIHERHMLIIEGYRRSSWDQRFEMFEEAVTSGMSMGKYIYRNTDSGFVKVQAGIVNMRLSLSDAESDIKKLERENKGLRSAMSVLVPQEEDGAAGAKRTRK